MDSLAKYVLSEITDIVAELILSWEQCEDNVPISDSGNNFLIL